MKKNQTPLLYFSRNYVEFGPFTAAEIAAFRERGILADCDYLRAGDAPDWVPVAQWSPASAPPAKARTPAPKAPAVKKRPAASKTPQKAA